MTIARHDLETLVTTDNADEITELGLSFNIMVGKIKELLVRCPRHQGKPPMKFGRDELPFSPSDLGIAPKGPPPKKVVPAAEPILAYVASMIGPLTAAQEAAARAAIQARIDAEGAFRVRKHTVLISAERGSR